MIASSSQTSSNVAPFYLHGFDLLSAVLRQTVLCQTVIGVAHAAGGVRSKAFAQTFNHMRDFVLHLQRPMNNARSSLPFLLLSFSCIATPSACQIPRLLVGIVIWQYLADDHLGAALWPIETAPYRDRGRRPYGYHPVLDPSLDFRRDSADSPLLSPQATPIPPAFNRFLGPRLSQVAQALEQLCFLHIEIRAITV